MLLIDPEPSAAGAQGIAASIGNSGVHAAAQQFRHGAAVIPPDKFQDDPIDSRPATEIVRIGLKLHHGMRDRSHVPIRTAIYGVRPEKGPGINLRGIQFFQQMFWPAGNIVIDRATLVRQVLLMVADGVRPVIEYRDGVASRHEIHRLRTLKKVQGEFHVVGRNWYAIMPADSIPETNRPGTKIGRRIP